MPLNNRNALFAPKADPREKSELKTETEDLRATTLAFVLGLRGNTNQTVPTLFGEGDAPQYNGHNVGFQPAIMPGMPGTERFQQLCSIEYLQAYFYNVLAGKAVALDAGMVNPGDLAKAAGIDGSEAAGADDVYQGIFARDFGPFLKGKGGKTGLVTCTPNNLPYTETVGTTTKRTNPSAVSRNLGDDTAFERLEDALAQAGLTDWRPDGIVLSKGVNDPSDKMSDEMLEARDGQLYNLRVQGPAIGTTWTGERSMETLPMDKVFVVLIADVWFNPEAEGVKYAQPGAVKDAPDRAAYQKERTAALAEGLDATRFASAQNTTWVDGAIEKPVLCNFRLEASTSAEMINYSQYRTPKVGQTQYAGKKRKLDVGPRMNLKLCNKFGEYIVGGWQIGNVMDTSASRAAMPTGSNIGVRTAPNSSALNINVNIGWWSADRLSRAFNNADGTVTPRYVKTKVLAESTSAINQQLTQAEYASAATSAAAAAATAAAARDAVLRRVAPLDARPGGSDDVPGVQVGA